MRVSGKAVLVGAVLTVFLVAGAGLVWIRNQIDPGSAGKPVLVTVPRGLSTSGVADLLERKGVITNATVFRYYAELKGLGPIQAGDYQLRRHSGLDGVVTALRRGASIEEPDRLTIPEGLTVDEIAERVGRLPGRSTDRFLGVARSGTIRAPLQPAESTTLEGMLYPDTYFFTKKDDETAILSRMVDGLTRTTDELGYDQARAKVGLSPYQTVIVASLVEREAKVDEDRGKVARVIYNRLAKGMPLQIDATLEYELPQHKTRLLDKDKQIGSPYNTYKIAGLPPGPIANPGRKSLEAAIDPTPGPWLYYVLADATGRHAFASNLAEFNRLVAQAHAKGLL